MNETNKYKKLLPIGSVVTLEGIKNRLMITGHLQKQANSEIIWDYAAVPYPVGLIDPTHMILFNHDKIVLISYIGLQDEEGLSYMEELFFITNGLEREEKREEE